MRLRLSVGKIIPVKNVLTIDMLNLSVVSMLLEMGRTVIKMLF